MNPSSYLKEISGFGIIHLNKVQFLSEADRFVFLLLDNCAVRRKSNGGAAPSPDLEIEAVNDMSSAT